MKWRCIQNQLMCEAAALNVAKLRAKREDLEAKLAHERSAGPLREPRPGGGCQRA